MVVETVAETAMAIHQVNLETTTLLVQKTATVITILKAVRHQETTTKTTTEINKKGLSL
jgi:hypothetical protein